MIRFNKLIAIGIVFICSFSFCYGQEMLTGIHRNGVIMKEAKKGTAVSHRNVNPLMLPFIEDFSDYTGYPNSARWEDRKAFVNDNFAVYPPTKGVATLDCIDENGYVYSHANPYGFGADTLTSRPIRLDSTISYGHFAPIGPIDSVYFSFFYQPAGATKSYPYVEWERVGDQPEVGDSLILEFGYNTDSIVFIGYQYSPWIANTSYVELDTMVNPFFLPDTVYYVFEESVAVGEIINIPSDSLFDYKYNWYHAWSSPGCSVDDWLDADSLRLTYFKQVLIYISQTDLFRKNFQFRFRNIASLDDHDITGWASNVDQWNIDYIRIDISRNYHDYYPQDIAFSGTISSLLQNYRSMPWNQFRQSDMITTWHNDLINLYDQVQSANFFYSVVKNNRELLYQPTAISVYNARPYYPNGFHSYINHSDPTVQFAIPTDDADSALITLTQIFNLGYSDYCIKNDTMVLEQKFYNYYAYDDGTAEAGYTILSQQTYPEIYLAVKFTLAEADTLRSIRMWFNHVLNDDNVEPFTLLVWGDGNGTPGDVLYSMPGQVPEYANNFNDFYEYVLEEAVPVSGTFYVGFLQNHNVQLNIGFDQNNDARDFFMYKINNEWREPFLKGAPMIRPVLGANYHPVLIKDYDNRYSVSVYPNPTKDRVTIKTSDNYDKPLHYQLYDIYGQLLTSGECSQSETSLSLSRYSSGIYIIKIFDGSQFINGTKIIKR